jgi:hypothetical protein
MKSARVELSEANEFVSKIHRHHGPVAGHRFSIACQRDGKIVGVAICGRPVARNIDQKHVLEVLRCATDGSRNACSYLYGKAARIATELGFRAVITYTLSVEEGASLRACGWWPELLDDRGEKGTLWHSEKRPRNKTKGQGLGQKVRWVWLTGVD